MTETSDDEKLAEYQRRYRDLAAELAGIGFIHAGSVTRRYTRCASPGCKCHHDPPEPHGPYYQWTTKVHGKTVTRRLTEREANLYQDWIANDRHMRDIIGQMRDIAAQAAQLQLKTATQQVQSQAEAELPEPRPRDQR